MRVCLSIACAIPAVILSAIAQATPASNEVWRVVAEESFENYPTNAQPDTVSRWKRWASGPAGWEYGASGTGRGTLADDNAPWLRGVRCLRFEQTGPRGKDKENGSTGLLALKLLWQKPQSVQGVRVTFDWKVNEASHGWSYLAGPSNLAVSATFTLKNDDPTLAAEYRGSLTAFAAGYRPLPCFKPLPNTWYRTTVIHRKPFGSYTIYVQAGENDPVRTFDNLPLCQPSQNATPDEPPAVIFLGTWGYGNEGSVWYDNFKVETLAPDDALVPTEALINPPAARELPVVWAKTPPAIDGNLDDACWTAAKPLTGFAADKASPVTQPTLVRLAWDRQALYAAIDCREQAAGTIKAATKTQDEDRANWQDDLVEFFLQLGPDAKDYVQLAVSAGGAAFDRDRIHGIAFHPRWTWAVGRPSTGWTAELAIPWDELTPAANPFRTPLANEAWGANVIRYRLPGTPATETSMWSPMTLRGYHDPINFGLARFVAPDDMLWAEKLNRLPVVGDAHPAVTLHNPTDRAAQASLTLRVKGTSAPVTATATIAPKQSARIEVAATVAPQAEWQMEAGSDGDTTPCFRMTGRAEPTAEDQLRQTLTALKRDLASARAALGPLPPATVQALKTRLAEDAKNVDDLSALLEKESPSFEENVRIAEALRTYTVNRRLDGSLRLAQLMRADHAAGGKGWARRYLLATASSMDPCYPESVAAGDAAKGLPFDLAANEAESAQIQIVAPWEELKGVRVEATDLTNATGSVSASNVSLRLVGFLHSPNPAFPASGTGPDRRWYPDPLVGLSPFAIDSGMSKTVWVTVDVPAGTPPGVYTGHVRIAPEGRAPTDVRLTAKVRNFTLPARPTLPLWTWFWPDQGLLGLTDLGRYEGFIRDISRFKIGLDPSLGAYGSPAFANRIAISRTATGAYQFDYSKLAPFYEIPYRYGMSVMNIPRVMSTEPSQVRNADGSVTSSPGLSKEQLAVFSKQTARFFLKYGEDIVPAPVRAFYAQSIRDGIELSKRIGYFTNAYCEVIDEPCGVPGYTEEYRAQHELSPELPLMSFDVGPKSVPENIGINSIWAPALRTLTGELETMWERKKHGERLWTYICGGIVYGKQNRHSPDVFVWEPAMDRRIMAWLAWKWNLDSVFVFMGNGAWRSYYGATTPHAFGGWNPWPYDRPMTDWDGTYPEVGQFIYMCQDETKQWTWAPSIRMNQWRDGVEDYEYLHLVKTLRDELAKSRRGWPWQRRALLKEATRLLDLESEIPGTDLFGWNQDAAPYLARRRAMADWIEKVSAVLK